MGLFAACAFCAGIYCAISTPAQAVEPDAPEKVFSRLDAVVLTLLSKLEAKFKSGQGGLNKHDHGALVEFYAEPNRAPLWVDENGLTKRAREAIGELNSAADYGLNPSDYETPDSGGLTRYKGYPSEWLAQAELKLSVSVLAYVRHAHVGRVSPLSISGNMDLDPHGPDPFDALASLAKAEKPVSAQLRSHHPRHPQFEALRRQLLAARGRSPVSASIGGDASVPEGPALKPGDSHHDVEVIRKRLGLSASENPGYYDEELAGAVRDFQRGNGIAPSGVLGLASRHAMNRSRGSEGKNGLISTLLINMERWRWEPRDFGDFHVWVNIPEFVVRVKKGGQTIHEERVVAGKLEHQTPVLSRYIEYIEFNPYWNVPPSIINQEILPMLRRDPETLHKHQLEVYWQGKRMDNHSMDWTRVDSSKISMKQPPGQGNVLGTVKFGFPNRHDVYMHDTPTKQLFNNTVRAESHGCMRVRNPLKLAEVLLAGQGQGWNGGRIQKVIQDGGNQTVYLSRRVPIHLTYFTAWVDQSGKLVTFRDVYGHDPRLRSATRF
jgi:L,D-transpeptidase YcbB